MAHPPNQVIRYGTDSSGRGIYMSRRMIEVWEAILRDPRLAPFVHLITIVQGPWMIKNGGGAVASAGYHDRGGCLDIRTWNLTAAQLTLFIYVASCYGFQFWRRDLSAAHGGMDEHAHGILGWDFDLASGAAVQWEQVKNGRDGLASNGPDYERRKQPLVLRPTQEQLEEDPMADPAVQKQLDRIEKKLDDTNEDLNKFRTNESQRDKVAKELATKRYQALVTKLGGLADQSSGETRAALLKLLAEEQDVTGADNPAPEEAS